MKNIKRLLVGLLVLLVGCGPIGPQASPTSSVTATATLPGPQVQLTRMPDAQTAANKFLESWKANDYTAMYSELTPLSQDAISSDDFTKRYKDVAINMTLAGIDGEVLSALTNPGNSQVAYRVVFHTRLFGDMSRDMIMNLTLDKGSWQIQWEDGMILPELRGGNKLVLDYQVPSRGIIYDRNGFAFAAQSNAVALGVVPGEINPDQESTLLTELSKLTGLNAPYIASLYKDISNATWYIPVGEASADAVQARADVLNGLSGLYMYSFRGRYYDGGLAAQVIGWVQDIPKEQLEQYQLLGYRGDEKVGIQGLEKYAETSLAGKHGGSLYVYDPSGNPVTRLAQVDNQPAESVTTTLDKTLQYHAEKSLGGFHGAIVVMERDTGRILAMASSPTIDPNLFDPTNANFQLLGEQLGDGEQRILNRAAQDAYPLGSVFKIITISAALESGQFTAESEYNCTREFTELPGVTLYDWTYEKDLPASGLLTLPQGLMRSCNPWFYHIGLTLYRKGLGEAVPNMARAFGLGKATGIDQISEIAGNVPDPENESDSTQLAIGQSTLQVTPLQVAEFVAAVGNGGTLYRPQLIEKIAPPDGAPTFTFKPEETGKLPVSPENLKVVQDAMRSVIEDKRGTAHYVFSGISIPVYGKTGTAQTSQGVPNAWFAGYTDANRPDKPDIAMVVFAENAGEGSDIAAPIFRRVLEVYFNGQPSSRLFSWESSLYMTPTPTSQYTDTPIPSDTPVPTETPVPEDQPTDTPTP